MRPTVSDGIMLLYNYAVLLSGWVLVTHLGVRDRPTLLGLSAVIAVGWTVYFRFGMQPRLADRIRDETDE